MLNLYDKNTYIIIILLILVIICSIFGLISRFKYFRHLHEYEKKKQLDKDRASRRKISQRDKDYVLKRDNYTCQICGISRQFFDDLCQGSGQYLLLEIDHVKSVANGGRGDDLDNLQTLCWKCNRKKGGKKSNQDLINSIDYGIKYLTPHKKKFGLFR